MSTDTKHTPGPWRVRDLHGGTIDVAASNNLCLATCCGEPEVAVRLANGRLMAAAPDMLEALQWLDTLAEHLVIRHDLSAAEWSGLDRSLNSMVAHAKAAIAKARGTAA